MRNLNGDEVEINDVKNLIKINVTLKEWLECLNKQSEDQREERWPSIESIAELLELNGTPVKRGDLTHALKELADLGCGRFRVGRKGWKTRFDWFVSPTELLANLKGDAASTAPEVSELIKHVYRVRPNLEIEVRLPQDLTEKEALRLSEFIKTLHFEA